MCWFLFYVSNIYVLLDIIFFSAVSLSGARLFFTEVNTNITPFLCWKQKVQAKCGINFTFGKRVGHTHRFCSRPRSYDIVSLNLYVCIRYALKFNNHKNNTQNKGKIQSPRLNSSLQLTLEWQKRKLSDSVSFCANMNVT